MKLACLCVNQLQVLFLVHEKLMGRTKTQLEIPELEISNAQGLTEPHKRFHTGDYKSISRIVTAHAAFKAKMQPDMIYSEGFYHRCASEVEAVRLFFPHVQPEKTIVCFAAWLAFVCAMDDLLETMPPGDGETALLDSVEIVQGRQPKGIYPWPFIVL